jgi:secreted PhoX family phosphatase
LTCEENFQGVFGTDDSSFKPTDAQQRYGLKAEGLAYTIAGKKVGAFRWWEQDNRFDLANPDNDSNRFGFVVEIDPFDPTSTPIKHTALGRIKHENAEVVVASDGRVVVYMGDDEMNEFIYKFVSAKKWSAESRQSRESDQKLLDEGTLYVARFNSDGTGKWLALVPGENGIPIKKGLDDQVGFDDADICIRPRFAATIAGATPMDRPEWVSVNPKTNEVYVSLTNNKSRKENEVDGANPRSNNVFGHIVKWRERGDDPSAVDFNWQVFVMAGNPAHKEPTLHGNVSGDSFGCPDGLKFDSAGILWIQTDMSSSVLGKEGYAELGNNMMLAADPVSKEMRRFLTGPRGCEITGMSLTPDRRTMFVNIQHPGEPADDVSDPLQPGKISNWPDGVDGGRPRSATIAIRKLDGGTIGS